MNVKTFSSTYIETGMQVLSENKFAPVFMLDGSFILMPTRIDEDNKTNSEIEMLLKEGCG